jgi:hypothetical protein
MTNNKQSSEASYFFWGFVIGQIALSISILTCYYLTN